MCCRACYCTIVFPSSRVFNLNLINRSFMCTIVQLVRRANIHPHCGSGPWSCAQKWIHMIEERAAPHHGTITGVHTGSLAPSRSRASNLKLKLAEHQLLKQPGHWHVCVHMPELPDYYRRIVCRRSVPLAQWQCSRPPRLKVSLSDASSVAS